MKNKIDFGICLKEVRKLEESKAKLLNKLITVDSAIKYAKVSIYTMLKTTKTVDPKKIDKEMLFNVDRYEEDAIPFVLKGMELGAKKKW